MISRTVKAILAFTSTPPEAFWHSVGMSRSTYYNRINGETPWSAADVQHAADVLGVAVADLYDGRIPTGLPTWAPRGSNPQPTDFSVQLHLFGGDEEDPRVAVEDGFLFPWPRRPLMEVA